MFWFSLVNMPHAVYRNDGWVLLNIRRYDLLLLDTVGDGESDPQASPSWYTDAAGGPCECFLQEHLANSMDNGESGADGDLDPLPFETGAGFFGAWRAE